MQYGKEYFKYFPNETLGLTTMKTTSTTHHSFPWTHNNIDYIVEFTYFAPFAGARAGGIQLEPDSGDEIEVTAIVYVSGNPSADAPDEQEAEKAAWAWLREQPSQD